MYESRLQTPCKDEAASAHSCDDEGKKENRHARCFPQLRWGRRYGARRRCLGMMRPEQSCLAIAVEDGQTECIFECRANIVANGPHKRVDQRLRAKPNERNRNGIGESFAERKQPSDLLFQTADAPARGRIIKDVSVGESLELIITTDKFLSPRCWLVCWLRQNCRRPG